MRKDFFRNTCAVRDLLPAENITKKSVRLLARINSVLGVENWCPENHLVRNVRKTRAINYRELRKIPSCSQYCNVVVHSNGKHPFKPRNFWWFSLTFLC